MTPREYGIQLSQQVTRPLTDAQVEAAARILAGVDNEAAAA